MDYATETLFRSVNSERFQTAGTFVARRREDGSLELKVTSIAGEQIFGPAVTLLEKEPAEPVAA